MAKPERIEIEISTQQLRLMDGESVLKTFTVSTALNGAGQLRDSGCTPLGEHVIRLRIGEHCPANTVFVARRPTGELYSPELAQAAPGRDWILTRILWLSGCEPGINRGGTVDTLRRFIYIHGSPDSEPMGVPKSHGCIRMRNSELIGLFDQTFVNMPVSIRP